MNIIILVIFTILLFMIQKRENGKFPIYIPIILAGIFYYFFFQENSTQLSGGSSITTIYTDLPDF